MTPSDILIVRPEPSRGLGAFYRNLGLTMVASHLKARDLNPVLIDLTFEDLPADLSAVNAALFSLYIDDFARGMELAQQLKQRKPSLTTILGGPHATLLGQRVFELGDSFDIVGVGDCLPEAMPVIEAAGRGISTTPSRLIATPTNAARMDSLTPDYSIWPQDRYFKVFPVEFSRGCRQHCPFCTDPVLRKGIAIDPLERTIATIRSLTQEHGQIWVRFVDSSMSSLGEDLDRLLARLIQEDLPVRWSAYAYPHDISDDLAARMAAAGCVALFLGIESLGDGVRVGKHHTKHPKEVAQAVDALHRHGIFVHGNFIIGLPGETEATVDQTIAGLSQIHFDSVGGGPFFLTPGSTFDKSAAKHGITVLDPDWALRQHVNFYESDHDYFRTETLTQQDMRRLAGRFRTAVQGGLACWNLSDYAALCWLSVGGSLSDLTQLWNAADDQLRDDERLVLGVLKEKIGVPVAEVAGQFVHLAREVARPRIGAMPR